MAASGGSRGPGRSPGLRRQHQPAWHRPPHAARRRRRRIAVVVLGLLALTVASGVAFAGWAGWKYFTQGYVFEAPARGDPVTVVVPEGATLEQIAAILHKAKVVASARAFRSRAERDGYSQRFKPGRYELCRYDDYATIVGQLLRGGTPLSVKVTIPEGFTAEEMARLVARSVPGFAMQEYLDLTVKHPLPAALQGMRSGTRLEGLLFPATYEFPPLRTPRELVEYQLSSFRDTLSMIDLSRAGKRKLSAYDVVIIASMVEREVEVPAERPLVAAVIWNRLRLRMRLQVDATIAYALGRRKSALSLKDLKIRSPYNTYLHRGLPPTPICSPGLASLQAAAQPAHVPYLYYVVRNDGTGRHSFSTNYEQFLRDKAKAGL
jgi:UPF0755 protein